ncbi:SAM-dependent methyltransferase [Paenibacillus sp. P46E]|uniref:SAM-dependent methyltransferase n=1 Tax=Paenibacillus sp. P46E TaxID=1349436 RepID=UPI00093FAB8C|nr:SAM-dependent methyltransferase [Paenibacillus sp. P46E]OKP95580.1 SAM-dependent methyltransferase [Paenibacillus sp. P46E]
MSRNKLDLERIVFIGRTFEEYLRMFDLQREELMGRSILDCPAGACSFTAGANKLGAASVAADIAYDYSAEVLRDKGLRDIDHTVQQLSKVKDSFVWEEFASVQELQQARTSALTISTLDRQQFGERYVPVELPMLPFADQTFDLTLSAHFLFMYGDRLDYDFHLRTIEELMRVTKSEIRIFPLVDLSCQRYKELERLLCAVKDQGWTAEERLVPYEFQRGADSMLRLLRA